MVPYVLVCAFVSRFCTRLGGLLKDRVILVGRRGRVKWKEVCGNGVGDGKGGWNRGREMKMERERERESDGDRERQDTQINRYTGSDRQAQDNQTNKHRRCERVIRPECLRATGGSQRLPATHSHE